MQSAERGDSETKIALDTCLTGVVVSRTELVMSLIFESGYAGVDHDAIDRGCGMMNTSLNTGGGILHSFSGISDAGSKHVAEPLAQTKGPIVRRYPR